MEFEIALSSADASVYHGTEINALLAILSTDKFYLSQVAGKEAEERFSKHPFFLSVRRNKFNPHHYYSVTIEFDASKLNSRMKREAVNYWGHEAKHKHFEQEDRYYSAKPTINGVRKLIKAIYLDTKNLRANHKLRSTIIGLIRDGIKVYAFADAAAYRRLDKRKALKLSDITYGAKPVSVFRELSEDDLELQKFKGMRAVRDKYSDAKFVVDTLYSGVAPKRKEYEYIRDSLGYRMYETDLPHQFKNILHNASHGTPAERKMAARIQDYMTKHNLTPAATAETVRKIIRETDNRGAEA